MAPRITNGCEPDVCLTILKFSSQMIELTFDNFGEGSGEFFRWLKNKDGVKNIWYLRDELHQQFEVDMFAVIARCNERCARVLTVWKRRIPSMDGDWCERVVHNVNEEERFRKLLTLDTTTNRLVINMQLIECRTLEESQLNRVEAELQKFIDERHNEAGFTFDRIRAMCQKSEQDQHGNEEQLKISIIFGPTPEEAKHDDEKNFWEIDWKEWVEAWGW
ncbi:hypothetical protein ACJ72_01894 [Emergomyces africanus]|uniref:Uncharacterized protein n=1 Tax=Emergomyces africanus TaxID=1955775 RepID=A0A1B7P4F4_9EURO|nr:hypothetical protein ACJ72_01894 [Emergomyces africanus]